jgi:hypothetical protein
LLFLFVSLLGEEEKNLVASPSQEDDSVYAEAEEPPELVLADLVPGCILRTENTFPKRSKVKKGIQKTKVELWEEYHSVYGFCIFCVKVCVPGTRKNGNRITGDHSSETRVDFHATLPDGRGEGIIELQFCRDCQAHWREGSVFLRLEGYEMVDGKEMVSSQTLFCGESGAIGFGLWFSPSFFFWHHRLDSSWYRKPRAF